MRAHVRTGGVCLHTRIKLYEDITDTVNDVCTDCCYVMVRAVGYCLYRVQIRAHHHTDVYTDINERYYRCCK